MAAIGMMIGAVVNALAFTGSNYLFSTLSSSEERKRYDLALEKLQHDRDTWNQARLQRIDYINDQLKKQGHAERTFANVDDAMKKYYDLTGVLMAPLPPEPQLFDYLNEDQTKSNSKWRADSDWTRNAWNRGSYVQLLVKKLLQSFSVALEPLISGKSSRVTV